ncbi:uncharacterized protein TNCV_4903801 [Trichonephila clavipes]|nr:uncharacterized protein TNCV_4903801 [Trichonephila clavipes]
MTSNCDNLIVTKKSVISTVAKIFDPLGLIGYVITRVKILLQSLWQLKLDWNDSLPSNIVSYWKSFIDDLESINCLDIPRYCLQDKSIRTELHGFSDLSEKANGAALELELETLTSAHFLVGSELVTVPDPDYTEIPMNILSQWQLVQKMNRHFSRKWTSEYLNRLQHRPKWCKGNEGFKEGYLVLVKPSENSLSLK